MSIISTTIFNTVSNITINVFSNYLPNLLNNSIKKIKKLSREKKYLLELEEDLKKMEFKYPGLDADVLPNYIELDDIRQMDFQKLIIQSKINTTNADEIQLNPATTLNDRKILIMGEAGIGKSTFIKSIVIDCILKKKNKHISFKNTVPIFIPLKIIENRSASPILKYIFEELPYFKGNKGQIRLKKLIESQRLFLILDGYDELGFSEKEKWAQYEINLFIYARLINSEINKKMIDSKYVNFYSGISNCRTWVSTRENFYKLNPLQNLENSDYQESFTRYSNSVRLMGLDRKRGDFVQFIFSHYKDENIKNYLNTTLFLKTIDKTKDEHLQKISKTPLFLTIMCGVYINEIKNNLNKAKSEIKTNSIIPLDWKITIQNLVVECIDILLVRKDQERIPDSKYAKKIQFEDRRIGYPQEKKMFLYYFSWEIIKNEISSFDKNILFQSGKVFFENFCISENRKDILDELNDSPLDGNNIINQIINSDVFTQVNSFNSKKILYDFPHRRFREILATFYLENQERFQEFLYQILNPNLGEFVIVFFTTKKETRNEIVKALFNFFTNNNDYLYANSLLYKCLNETQDYNITTTFQDEVKLLVLENKYFKTSSNILSLITFTTDFMQWAVNKLKDLPLSNLNSYAFLYSLLIHSKELIVESLMTKELLNSLDYESFSVKEILISKFYFLYKKQLIEQTHTNKSFSDTISIKSVKDKNKKTNIEGINEFTISEKKAIILNQELRELFSNLIISLLDDDELLNSLFLNERKEILLTVRMPENTFRRIFTEEVLLILSNEEIDRFSNFYDKVKLDVHHKKLNLQLPTEEINFDDLSSQKSITLYLGYFLANGVWGFSKNDRFFKLIQGYLATENLASIFILISMIKAINQPLHKWLYSNSTIYSHFTSIVEIISAENFNDLKELNSYINSNSFLELVEILPEKIKSNLIRFFKTLNFNRYKDLKKKINDTIKFNGLAFSNFIFDLPPQMI